MIEKFDLTGLICMGGNMSTDQFEESQRLRWLINSNKNNLDYHLEEARFFASRNDDIHTIISYCAIIRFFDNNLTAYIELANYLWSISYYEWAMIVCVEGLKHHSSEKLKELLDVTTKEFIEMYNPQGLK